MKDEYTIEEAAAVLGLAATSIRRRVQLGQMQARRIGARVLVIPAAEVERARVEGKRKPGPAKGTKYQPRKGKHDGAPTEP